MDQPCRADQAFCLASDANLDAVRQPNILSPKNLKQNTRDLFLSDAMICNFSTPFIFFRSISSFVTELGTAIMTGFYVNQLFRIRSLITSRYGSGKIFPFALSLSKGGRKNFGLTRQVDHASTVSARTA
jgi:hypothetical protein